LTKRRLDFVNLPIKIAEMLDATDQALLALLRDNARAPLAELARKLGLSRTTVQSRLARLEAQRAVLGYTVVVPSEAEAALVRAHVHITAAPKQSAGIEAALRRIPEVRTLHSVSGPFDLIAVLAATSIGELDALIDRIGALDGVERTTSAIVLSTRIQR
jgi:DNA-binding Lrp family transcriptional regulator